MHKNIATGGEIMKKRIISLLMALLMLTSLLPTAVWAEGDTPEQAAAAATDSGTVEQEPAAPETPETPVEPEQPTEPEQSAEPEADAEPEDNGIALYSTASGQCGNNLTWTLDNGVLTISGTGAMWDWDNEWYGFCGVLDQADEVTSVVVESGVTSIAYEAFNWLENMTSVTIPKTVTAIGCSAFLVGCDALTTINYAGTTSQWKKISSTLSLPLATKVVCSNGTVTPALSGKCGKNVSYSISDDGVLTISGTGAMNNFTYERDISDCPWHGVRYALKKIVVKEGVTSIGSYAFSFDLSVTDVTLPSSLKTIGNDAFLGCHGLTSVVIPEGVTSIGAYAFWRCTSLQTITVPASATKFGDHAFDTREYYDGSYHTQLTDIYYGGSRQQWYDAGGGDAALTDVTVHFNGTTGDIIDGGQCGDSAFWKLDKDYTLTIYGTGAMYDYYPDDNGYLTSPWINFDVKKIDVQEGITTIGAYAFCCTVNATALSLPDSLTSIGQDAFCCYGGTEIVVPDKVTSIGDFAFNTCNNLQTITLPAGLQNIGICFIECDALKTINFGGTMEQWLVCGGGQSTFPTTTSVVCQGGGTLYRSGTCGNNLTWTLDSSGKLTISGTGDMSDYTHDFENNIRTSPWADYRSMIRSIEIGSGVTHIGAWAFKDTNITSLNIPGNVKSLGAGSFSDNRYLVNLTFSSGLKRIESMAFAGSHLSTVVIPDGVTSIGERAFSNCVRGDIVNGEWVPSGLTAITIPASVISIGKDMLKTYDEYDLLANVNFGGTQEQWNAIGGKDSGVPDTAKLTCATAVASGKCGTGVKWSLASNGVLTITGTGKGIMKDYAEGSRKPWESKGDVKQIIICEGVTHIGDHAFANSPATRVSLPESLTSIGTRAFAGAAITAMTIPGSVTTIGVEVFWGCSDLTSLTIRDGVTSIESAFGKCTGLTELVLPDSVTSIGTQAFYRCTGLRTVTLSKNLTSIGYMAFSGCTGLTDLVFPDSLKEIDQEAFRYCSGLNSISLGTGLTTIGRMAFDGCDPTAVDYRGTQKEWRSIAIGNKNDCLSRVTCIKLGVIVTDGDTPDVTDVASLYDHLAGQAESEYTPQQELSADVNRDGTLDVYDLQLLYEAVAQGTEL